MPRTATYTPGRRTIMQLVMCTVLAAAIGAAAIVDQHLTPLVQAARIGAPRSNGLLHYRLPVGWVIVPSTERYVAVVASDPVNPSDVGPRRTVVIFHRHLAQLTTPADFLEASGLMEEIFGNANPGDQIIEPTMLAGQPAIRIRGQSQVTTNGQAILESDIVVCAVFPNQHAVTLWLAKLGPFTTADLQLFDQLSNSISLGGMPTIEPN